MNKNNVEPLLQEDDNRYVMFPIKDQEIWQAYRVMRQFRPGNKKNDPFLL